MCPPLEWQRTESIEAKSYTCGYCGSRVLSREGYWATDPQWEPSAYGNEDPPTLATIYICHVCHRPSFFHADQQVPGGLYGNSVEFLPPDVANLYQEARKCVGASAYTAATMVCRKILMNVAVDRGSETNRNFIYYVNDLAAKGYIPKDEHNWVGWIRDKGNEANHEIPSISRSDAELLVSFVEILLKHVYELPRKVPPKA